MGTSLCRFDSCRSELRLEMKKNMNLEKDLEELKIINKELLELLSETTLPGSQAYFDMLFLEFSNIVKNLEAAGVPEEDLLELCRDVQSPATSEQVSKMNSYYSNFIKFGKKTKVIN